MTFPKRTWLYLIRKKGKTLILFLLIFTISAFTLSCFSILYATDEVAANMRTVVGAAFHIRPSAGISMQETNLTEASKSVITEQTVHQIMEGGNLKYYNGRNSGYAKGLSFLPGAYHTDENNMGQVYANNYSALHPHFQEKVLQLIEGRHITQDDRNAVVISETLAALNKLSLGDEVLLSPAELSQKGDNFIDANEDTTTTAKATVIGIFRELELQGDAAYQPTAGLRSNLIFSDHNLLVDLGEAIEGEYTGSVSFYIQDPLYLTTVVNEVQQTDSIDWNSYFIRMDDFNYEKISAGLKTIQNLIKTLLLCVSVVSGAVLILILAMRMRGRVHEAGIFMSIGIAKRKILAQFITEVAVIAIVAFVCAYFAAGAISGRIEGAILENLQVVQIEASALETGLVNHSELVTLLTMPIGTTILIYACLLIVIITSVCLSSLAIIKLKLREILSKHE